jgi:hypothetical protein
MSFDGNENHNITLTAASALTKEYRKQNPTQILGGFFGKQALLDLLNQTGAMGIRYYYGQDAAGGKVLVLCAADANEDDMLSGSGCCKEMALICPPRCGQNNSLNS